jgi:hypothetical protein
MRGPIFNINMKDFYILTRTLTSDGRGGSRTTYTKCNTVKGCLTAARLDSEMIVVVADAETATASFVLFTNKSDIIPFDTIIQRASDSKTYRVISDATDQASPDGAPIYLRMHIVEEFELDGQLLPPTTTTGEVGDNHD